MNRPFLWQTNNYLTLYKKPLIYLVVFCFFISPLSVVFAEEQTSQTIQENVVLDNLNSDIIDETTLEVKDVSQDKLSTDPVVPENLDQVVPLEEDPDINLNNDENKEITPEAEQSLSSNGVGGKTEYPTGKLDGLYGSKPKTDLITGAMNYSYPITIPQGRLGMTPEININYNSQENENGGVFGYSWGLDIPYIERVNKNGSEKIYSEKYFTSSIDGELIEISPGVYRPRVDNGGFHEYFLTNNSWVFKDKSGVTYKFGTNADSRQDNISNTNQVYKWMLDEKRDLNGNYITYKYYKDAGEIYPQKINYTEHSNSPGIFEVEFFREIRSDSYTSYKTAFKVTTSYRINEIQAKVNGNWVKKYVITYTTGDNGFRSLINSITLSSKDKNGVIKTLPPSKFTYQKTTPGWDEDSVNWSSPVLLGDNHEMAIDIKGDSWVDIIQSVDRYGQNLSTGPFHYDKVLYNHTTNKDWKGDSDFKIPITFLNFEVRGGAYGNVWDQGVRVADINGDQLPDIVQSANGGSYNSLVRGDIYHTYIYDKINGWVKDLNWEPKIPFTGRFDIHDYGTHLVDLNGDTLPDIIRSQGSITGEQLNTGYGFTNITTNWNPPIDELTFTTNRMVDINADGLADAVSKHWYNLTEPSFAYLNKGDTGWVNNTNWLLPIILANNYYDQGVRFLDVNSDNLIDIVIDPVNQTGGNRGTYLNTGNGWVYKPIWDLTVPNNSLMSNPVVIADINSDGFVDFLRTQNSTPTVTIAYINKGNKIPDLLSKIEYGTGAVSEISYKKSSQYKDTSGNLLNPNLPINLNTVESIITNDGLGNTTKTSYEYSGGSYYYNNAFDRKFAGFSKVVQINPDNTKEITYYHQANDTDISNGETNDNYSKIGKVYRIDLLDPNNNLLKQNTIKWFNNKIQNTNSNFIYTEQLISRTFNGGNSYDTAETYLYDTQNGNLLNKIEFGLVSVNNYQSFIDVDNDIRKTEYSYTNCNFVVCSGLILPSKIILKDYNGNRISEKIFYYDNLQFGYASVGNKTSESIWSGGVNYQTIKNTYNIFGLITSVKDARNNTNSINYDYYYLYPSSVTNALSQTTSYTYDYNHGGVLKSIDPNGFEKETEFDGFGRPLIEKNSSDLSYTPLVISTIYYYNDTFSPGLPSYIKKINYYNSIFTGESYIILDGLGREIRKIEKNGSVFIASDIVYDNMGREYKRTLPYTLNSNFSSYNGPNLNNNITTTMSYDYLNRPLYITNTLGTTTNIYNLNKTTVVDSKNNKKDIIYNAFGKITSVIEYDGLNSHTTKYVWDTLGNLVEINDALGNVRSIKYDPLGNILTLTDLHEVSDTNYGIYSYSYDDNNNLIQKITPNGNNVRYNYDSLNRVTGEINNGMPQITYSYDACSNGIGRLCSVSRIGSSIKNFIYTNRGLISEESTSLGTKKWSLFYEYDNQGNILSIKYPDQLLVRYTYNDLSQIINIDRKNTPTSPWVSVIDNISYNVLGQKESIKYANGRTQNYFYDDSKQYQLIRNLLNAPVTYAYPNLIDTNYQWDTIGNLTQKIENFNPLNPQIFNYNYDGLSRLTSATKTVSSPLSGYSENYSYNAVGNILNKTGVGSYLYDGTAPGVYANPHAATSVGGIDYIYDKNGNVIEFGNPPDNTVLTYSYRNELIKYQKITPPNPILNTYLYDYSGARIKTTNSSGVIYNPSKYFEENATINKRYIYLENQLIATLEGSTPATSNIYYIHPDYLGGTQIVTDSAGSLKVQDIEYYPFGQILSNIKSGAFDESHKYTGHEYDIDTGLNFMQARYQHGGEGRFWQQDPIVREIDNSKLELLILDPQRWNSYSYASNNPLKYIDPDGKFNIKTGEVEKGDTLGGITNRINKHFEMNLNMSQIANASGIKDSNKIKEGMFISLPTNDAELHFNNEYLSVYSRIYDSEIGSLKWKATSGKPEIYDPIPEGNWKLNPKDTEYFFDLPTRQIGGSLLAKGLWPGSVKSWGSVRTEIRNENNIKETGFYVHGGLSPGSKGCIDLISNSAEFHRWFVPNNKTLNLIVNYN